MAHTSQCSGGWLGLRWPVGGSDQGLRNDDLAPCSLPKVVPAEYERQRSLAVKITILRFPTFRETREARTRPAPPISALVETLRFLFGTPTGALRSPTTVKQPSVPYSCQVSWRAPQQHQPQAQPQHRAKTWR